MVTPLIAARELIGVMYNGSALTRSPVDELGQVRTAVLCSHLTTLFLHRRSRFDGPANSRAQKGARVQEVLRAFEENPNASGAAPAIERGQTGPFAAARAAGFSSHAQFHRVYRRFC